MCSLKGAGHDFILVICISEVIEHLEECIHFASFSCEVDGHGSFQGAINRCCSLLLRGVCSPSCRGLWTSSSASTFTSWGTASTTWYTSSWGWGPWLWCRWMWRRCLWLWHYGMDLSASSCPCNRSTS